MIIRIDYPEAAVRLDLWGGTSGAFAGLDRFNLVSHSIYKILEENYGLVLAHCSEQISAAAPTQKQKRLLQANGAVLVVNRRTYTNKETPVELATTAYRGDLYRAVVHSVRKTGEGH